MMTDCTGRIVTKTPRTEAAYQTRAHNLLMMAKREDAAVEDLADLIDWFGARHSRWAPSTVRQYRAALAHALETATFDAIDKARLNEQLHAGPAPKTKGPKRTSARKRKSLKRDEFVRLGEFLRRSARPDDLLVHSFIALGAALFLRPVEYLNARVEGTMLIVANAKATNGRGNGAQRERDLSEMEPKAIAALKTFLVRLRTALRDTGNWTRLRDRLAARLARICKRLKIARVSFYTLRHTGMATAKTWMSPVEVAAAAGHAAVRTATSHYAKRRTGWLGLKLAGKPSAASIARVRGQPKLFQPRPSIIGPSYVSKL